MQSPAKNIVIIGGGQAGAQTAFSLRQAGYSGGITLIGDEASLPYQRPPLSKAYLLGDFDRARLWLKPQAWYDDADIAVRQETPAMSVDRSSRSVTLSSGETLAFDNLVIATGARPKKLSIPGASLPGVFDLRTLADVDSISSKAAGAARAGIVGAGYIGLEAAASLRKLGLDVSVFEYAPRVLARVTSPVVSTFFENVHRENGSIVHTDARVNELIEENGTAAGVRFNDDQEIRAELIIIGVGVIPNTEIAKAAGLECNGGVVVDDGCRTNDPNILAAGDCTLRPLQHYGRMARLESVHNAIEQGKIVAASILGLPRPKTDCPWFWSDQYDIKLQIAGVSDGHDHYAVRGEPESGSFSVFYFAETRLIAVDAINANARPAPEALGDTAVPLKEIAAQALSQSGD